MTEKEYLTAVNYAIEHCTKECAETYNAVRDEMTSPEATSESIGKLARQTLRAFVELRAIKAERDRLQPDSP